MVAMLVAMAMHVVLDDMSRCTCTNVRISVNIKNAATGTWYVVYTSGCILVLDRNN